MFRETFRHGLEMWLIAENKNNTPSTSANTYFAKKGPEGQSFLVTRASVS